MTVCDYGERRVCPLKCRPEICRMTEPEEDPEVPRPRPSIPGPEPRRDGIGPSRREVALGVLCLLLGFGLALAAVLMEFR